MNSKSTTAHVLYVDHQGHPAPLTECFHATAARHLSSTLEDRYPPSSVAEVDSAYCPQCLSFHDAASAARMGFCPKVVTCSRCPRCVVAVAPVTVGREDDADGTNKGNLLCYYQCGRCDWTSKECNLTVPLAVGDGENVDKLEIAKAAEELGVELKRRRDEVPTSALDDYMRQALVAWDMHTKPSSRSILKGTPFKSGKDDMEKWSLETLESSLEKKRMQHYRQMATTATEDEQTTATITTGGPLTVQRLTLDDVDFSCFKPPDISLQSFQWQVLASPLQQETQLPQSTVSSPVELLPLPTPLRVRKSRRCRAELAEGRPGILLKPKLNPLEGDSSLRTGHGQWWKKDSSAIHVVPHIKVVQHEKISVVSTTEEKETFVVFLLQISNPTLSMVRLRLASSSYQGEYEWQDDEYAAETSTSTRPTTTNLQNLLVDTLTQSRWHVALQKNVANDMEPTETVELSSAEDSIIELGGKSAELPQAVRQWKAETTATMAAAKVAVGTQNATINLVANNSSKAWFELAIPLRKVSVKQDGVAPAIPVQLQVELGNGSWESSLIKAIDDTSSGKDWVTFDFLVAWK